LPARGQGGILAGGVDGQIGLGLDRRDLFLVLRVVGIQRVDLVEHGQSLIGGVCAKFRFRLLAGGGFGFFALARFQGALELGVFLRDARMLGLEVFIPLFRFRMRFKPVRGGIVVVITACGGCDLSAGRPLASAGPRGLPGRVRLLRRLAAYRNCSSLPA
jgi:hypothetical protein